MYLQERHPRCAAVMHLRHPRLPALIVTAAPADSFRSFLSTWCTPCTCRRRSHRTRYDTGCVAGGARDRFFHVAHAVYLSPPLVEHMYLTVAAFLTAHAPDLRYHADCAVPWHRFIGMLLTYCSCLLLLSSPPLYRLRPRRLPPTLHAVFVSYIFFDDAARYLRGRLGYSWD